MKIELSFETLPDSCKVMVVAKADLGVDISRKNHTTVYRYDGPIVAQGETVTGALDRLHQTVQTKVWLDWNAKLEKEQRTKREEELNATKKAVMDEKQRKEDALLAAKQAYYKDPGAYALRLATQDANEEIDSESLAVRKANGKSLETPAVYEEFVKQVPFPGPHAPRST